MGHADNPAGSRGQSSFDGQSRDIPPTADLVILGGGIMGLWAAVKAERLGIETVLVDAGRLGQGASGGLLGALMPHMPDKWNDKKQYQFDALLSLEDEIVRIEAATGIPCGYRRCGRLIPLPKPHLRTIALRHSQDAEAAWRHGDRRFHWHVIDRPLQEGWPDASFAGAGLVHDTFAARVSPRGLTSALATFLYSARHVRIVEGVGAEMIEPAMSKIVFTGGESITFGHCIVAAGHRSFPLIEPISPPLPGPIGQPVKGQAALLAADIDPALPVIFLNGLYVVAHEGGHVAVGSTSEETFEDAFATDALLDDLIVRARALVPALKDAQVIERWAGLRPKAIDRDPMVGPHPDHPNVIALTGGFKVSFGLAHELAEAALDAASSREMRVPASFTLTSHLEMASR
ncbi:NAD(P)/FAD-dependent oxidoreductase [Neorhizobium petrolearium]|uniref:FAD-binding oxidoreductase n=1 Tax=Neorhizobium petrolearium TaxID=515361 RepID=A0ABY8M8P7_9HYPH|nr:FAD-binding oxidoreductase [Neorhizobium petrolearium]MCC2610808.1 FAD-binding oxidoreductase [Neorhizobium petrolearium]WGI70928.1 FAD-binding oxidoreductase [Neorhizobium petrolearium]